MTLPRSNPSKTLITLVTLVTLVPPSNPNPNSPPENSNNLTLIITITLPYPTIPQTAAAAVVVQQDQFVDVAEEQAEAEGTMIGEGSGEEFADLAGKFDAREGLVEKSMMNPQTGTIQDKYTKIYMPVSYA